MVSKPICIYCKQQDKLFTRDHVIPEAFGRFRPDIVLRDCVCAECNQHFGDSIELRLARGSIEGLERWKHGLKSPVEANKILQDQVTTTVEDAGHWQGARGRLVPGNAERPLGIDPIPQAGFRRADDEEWTWIPEDELTEETVTPFRGKGVQIRITGPQRDDSNRVIQKLKGLGINFTKKGELCSSPSADGVAHIRAEAPVDKMIFRAVAKISFNYLAYTQSVSFVLRNDFDPIRRFIMHGEMPSWTPVKISKEPILFGESRLYKQTNGHLVTVSWDRTGVNLISQVSLFNTLKYRVCLCVNYSGVWYDLSSGRHFDLESREATELRSARVVVPVVR